MRITVKPVTIVEDPANEVTSEKVFQARKIREGDRYLYHKEGIFSEKIFGKFGKCYCGERTKPGYCKSCGCRVLSKRNVPNFYIKFGFDLPNRVINYGTYDKQLFSNLLECKGFLYEGEYVEFDLKQDLSKYDESKVLFGKDAIMSFAPIDDTNEETLKESTAAREALSRITQFTSYSQIREMGKVLEKLGIKDGMIVIPDVKRDDKVTVEVTLSDRDGFALEVTGFVKK